MAKNNSGLATVLAFEKKLVPSDAYMYGTSWENRGGEASPIHLVEKSVRGTISNRQKPAVQNDPAKLNAEVEKPNLQTVDSASLSMQQDTLKLHFTLKVLSGVQYPSACNNEEHKLGIQNMGNTYIKERGFKELARRYALNLANGRFLWRNRVGAEQIEIIVKDVSGGDSWTFNAYDFSLKDFDAKTPDAAALAEKIAAALCGKQPYLLLDVTAYVLLGKGQEIYPSEELILDKGRGNKSKILYQVDEVAAMHSQKIGNAIRTIDTWYPEFETAGIGPIAIEPFGAVTNLGRAYRSPKEKCDFYTLFDQWSMGKPLGDEKKEDYVMAVLVRGGVFGQSGKD